MTFYRLVFKTIIIGFLLTSGLSFTFCQSDKFEEGNKLYKSGDYSKAIEAYSSMVDEGLSSAELYHNLGTSYLRVENIAKSVLYLEKAIHLDPSNNSISTNLAAARLAVDSDIMEIPDFILFRFWESMSSAFHPLLWIFIQALFGILLLLGLYRWQMAEDSKLRLKGLIMALSGAFLLTIAIAAGFKAAERVNQNNSAVVMNSTSLKSGADERSEDIELLSSGIKVEITDKIDQWYKVQLINKEEGWLSKSDLEII